MNELGFVPRLSTSQENIRHAVHVVCFKQCYIRCCTVCLHNYIVMNYFLIDSLHHTIVISEQVHVAWF